MPVLRVKTVNQAREGTHFADVLQPTNSPDCSLYAQPEAAVRHAAVLAQIDVPLIRLHRQAMIANALDQQAGIRHALGTADDLTVPLGREQVRALAYLGPTGP